MGSNSQRKTPIQNNTIFLRQASTVNVNRKNVTGRSLLRSGRIEKGTEPSTI